MRLITPQEYIDDLYDGIDFPIDENSLMNESKNIQKGTKKAWGIGIIICFLISFFNFWGTANWYQGIDKPTLWQRVYKWRISPKRAWKIASVIWLNSFPE